MRRKLPLAFAIVGLASLTLAAPNGTSPRASASGYATHAQQDGMSVGARLLTAADARKTFVSDVNRCCVIVELAIYPEKDRPVALSLDSFTLRASGTETLTKPWSAEAVSTTLQKRARERRDILVSPTFGIGYQSKGAYDPTTGTTRGGGVYTSVGVSLAVGPPGLGSGSTDKDRAVMETELNEKGLAEGWAVAPVAGYLFFPLARNKKATYELGYTLNGTLLTLSLK